MTNDPELSALATVFATLKDLEAPAQLRVIDYVANKLGLTRSQANSGTNGGAGSMHERDSILLPDLEGESQEEPRLQDEFGISPVALKWMKRNDLTVDKLGRLFSLGVDEIDLVAKAVPGKSRNERTRTVTLLKGIASYLSTGAARLTNEQIKEACTHYDAYDPPNHAKYLKGMASELSGNKSNGFLLTARGMTSATDLIKSIVASETK